MPGFSFVPNIVDKPKKVKSTKKASTKLTIIENDVDGVMFITPSFDYTCKIGEQIYKVHEESFRCKNRTYIYSQSLVSGFCKHSILNPNDRIERYRLYYAPFRPGSYVNGKIVEDENGDQYFLFNCLNDDTISDLSLRKEAYKYAIDHAIELEEVRMNLLSKIFNE